MGEATRIADSVVLGRISSIDRGGSYGPNDQELGWYAVATIDVEQVIAGDDSGDQLSVPLLLVLGSDRYPAKELGDLQRSIPTDPAVLFLTSWSSYFDRAQTEVPGWLADLDRPDIYRTIGMDGAIRVVEGRLVSPTHESTGTSRSMALRSRMRPARSPMRNPRPRL